MAECWAVTKRDVLKIDALDQWCLRKLLGIKWYHHMRNDEVRRTTGQPRLSAIVQAQRLSLFGHIARMPDETVLRSASRRQLLVPRHNLSTYGRRAFSVAGPAAWNCLCGELREPLLTANSFRQLLKTRLFAEY